MAAGSGSSVPVFGGKIETCVEKLESYLKFHGTIEGKKKHVLIMGLSEAQYEKPKEKDYNDFVTLLESHFGMAINKMVERAKFHGVRKTDSKNVTDYVVRLRTQTRTCEFGTMLDENLLEQFRIGVNSKTVRDRVAAMVTEQQHDLKKVIKVFRWRFMRKLPSFLMINQRQLEPSHMLNQKSSQIRSVFAVANLDI
ncbi:hypothetical protein EB796_010478 [Bugula neritina]|uniref:Uncharacterized protein n=1 Tax=Bugula neritina TaxID=10212 RepID=A0A7J7JY10_BUGNE|nr:hypothetical protein EB796_010478 [Bugula neritina]